MIIIPTKNEIITKIALNATKIQDQRFWINNKTGTRLSGTGKTKFRNYFYITVCDFLDRDRCIVQSMMLDLQPFRN